MAVFCDGLGSGVDDVTLAVFVTGPGAALVVDRAAQRDRHRRREARDRPEVTRDDPRPRWCSVPCVGSACVAVKPGGSVSVTTTPCASDGPTSSLTVNV